MSSSDDRLEQLFEAERTVAPAPEQAARGWERLASALAKNSAPMTLAAGPIQLGFWTTAKVMATALIGSTVVAGGVALTAASRHPNPPPTAPARDVSRLSSHDRAELEPPVVPVPSVAASDPAPFEATAPQRVTPEPSAAPASSRSSSFEHELALIELAKRELDHGQPHLAQALLEEHRSRYPNGAFAGERDGLLVLLACANGSGDSRRELAERFARSHPGSPLNDRIARACATSSAVPAQTASSSAKSFPPENGK